MNTEASRVICQYCGGHIPEQNIVIHEARCQRGAAQRHMPANFDVPQREPSNNSVHEANDSTARPLAAPDDVMSCPNCTYINDNNATICAMCQSSIRENSIPAAADIIDISDDSIPSETIPSDILACPNCTYLNNTVAAVCAMCQSPLVAREVSACITCPRCTYAHNAVGANYCSMCSAPLHDRTPQRPHPRHRNNILTAAAVGGAVGLGLSYIRGGNPIAGAVAGAGVGALAGSLCDDEPPHAAPTHRQSRAVRRYQECRRSRHSFNDEDFVPFQDMMMMPYPGDMFYQMVLRRERPNEVDTLHNMSYDEMLRRFPGNVPRPTDAATIRSLPTRTIQREDPPANCSICLCDFQAGEEAKMLHCMHSFHSNCIDTWLQQSGTCPICKTAI